MLKTKKDKTMEWLLENKEWLFGGIGVTVIGLIYSFFLKKKKRSDNLSQTQNQHQTVNIEINDGNKKNVTNHTLSKSTVQILFIDDQKFKTVDNLKAAGFPNCKSTKDVKDLNHIDVNNSDIIFVDINGVGQTLFPKDQGLGLAEALKNRYPQKYIVIYSAEEQGDRFHKALKKVDNTLSKNADPYEFINIIENYCNEVSD